MHPKVIASLHYIILAYEWFHRNALFLYSRGNLYANSKSLCCPPETKSIIRQYLNQGFPGGSVVKNLSASAGDRGSIPGPGRCPCAMEQLSPCVQLLSACPRACALQQEKPPQWEARTLQLESSPRLLQLGRSPHSKEEPAQPKIMNK